MPVHMIVGQSGTSAISQRSTDFTMSASTTASLGMSLPYTAGETWIIRYVLFINNTAGLAGLQFKLNTIPTSLTGRMVMMGPTSGLGTFSETSTSTLTTAAGGFLGLSANGMVVIEMFITGGSADGTIDLMMTTGLLQAGTLYKESYAMATRV